MIQTKRVKPKQATTLTGTTKTASVVRYTTNAHGRLHPDADEMDILPASADDPKGVELMEGDVITMIDCLNTRSTRGATGWTNQCIRTLMLHVTAE